MSRFVRGAGASVLACLLALACAASGPAAARERAGRTDSMKDDRAFDEVRLGTREQSACSPEIDPFDSEFRGLLVAAPSKVARRSASAPPARLPVCITGQLSLREVRSHPDLAAAVELELTDVATGRVLRGSLADGRPSRPAPQTDFDEAEQEARIDRFFFNVDASEVVALPARAAEYELRVRLGERVSNTLRVSVE